MEDLTATWGSLMTAIHSTGADKSATRAVSARCPPGAGCRWCLPEGDPQHLRVPKPFPARFQNIIGTGELQNQFPACPTLFCGEVGEGGVDESGLPSWLYCREANCNVCGFASRFPACPTLTSLPSVTCRVMSSAVRYLEWVVGGRVGQEPARKKMGEIDQLVEVKLPGATFVQYVNERMNIW